MKHSGLPYLHPVLIALITTLLNLNLGHAQEIDWETKVESRLLMTEGKQEFLVVMHDQADLSRLDQSQNKLSKNTQVSNILRESAAFSQKSITNWLTLNRISFRSFWIVNMLWAEGDQSQLQQIASRSDVARIYANPVIQMDLPKPDVSLMPRSLSVEPNLIQVGAPDFWAAGFTGQGIVIGGQDTGYEWTHPALQPHYRGWNGVISDHNHNWHDAIHGGNDNSCGFDLLEPCDDVNHGTHTMGIMVGDDGADNQTGVAPGAQWIGCRNMNRGRGTPASYTECFQWFMAPTDLNGENPDPSKAPHVINNSWSCPESEGCMDPEILKPVVENIRAAGIVVVVSAGNNGLICESIRTPAAIYDASLTVGAVSATDLALRFSSRGPVSVDGSNRMKPDITAPGDSIRSSVPGGNYSRFDGTSMSAPHVTGMVALLMSRYPEMIGRPDLVEQHLFETAEPLITFQTCGNDNSSSIPNNVFGHGSLRAVESARLVFVDGFEGGGTPP